MTEKDYRDVLKALEPISATSDATKLSKIYGLRFDRAWELLKGRAVKKYIFKPSEIVRWMVVGRQREYLICPTVGFCSCNDFFFRRDGREGPILSASHRQEAGREARRLQGHTGRGPILRLSDRGMEKD